MFYRLRQAIHYAHFRFVTRAIYKSPPIPCDPSASCAIHTMLCVWDLPLYVVAIKSLLRWYPSVAVVIYSDGSLDEHSTSLLQRHVPGCRIIGAEEADRRAAEVLGKGSFLFAWRALDVSWRRIVDTELWSQAESRIIMDSDIVTVWPPHEVIEWIEQAGPPLLFGQPSVRSAISGGPSESTGAHDIQTIFKKQLHLVSEAMGLPNRFLDGTSSGFYCCRNELVLDKIERLLRTGMSLGIPMREWGAEQCTVIYLLSVAGARRLNPEQYINFDPAYVAKMDRVAIAHFYGTYRFHKNIYPTIAAQIARDLARSVTREVNRPVIPRGAR